MNAELITALRYCKDHEACDHDASSECPYWHHWIDGEDCAGMLVADAADALEAAEQQIAELKDYINYLWELLDALREEFKKMRGEQDEQ